MGGHYGSIHIRTEDHPRVKAAAEQVAAAMKIRVLLGPALNGWVGLYPEHNGQDDAVSRELARHISDPLLHLMVHDDDIFAYWLYTGGQLVDSFWSAPGYFGEENRAAEERMAGNPEAFRPILGDRTDGLATLLSRDDEASPTFEYERLEKFAKLLKIPNAVTAYEYLQEGERDGIRGWRSFEEVPASAKDAERAERRREADQLKAERRRLIADGALLLVDERKEGAPYGCALENSFVVAWPDHLHGTLSFSRYEEPWARPQPLTLECPAHVTAVATDAARRRVAMTARDRVRVWDVAPGGEWHVGADVPEADLPIDAALSADGRTLAHVSRQEFVVTDVATGRRLYDRAAPGRRHITFHPSGEWLAVSSGATLALVHLADPPRWLELYVGGLSPLPSVIGTITAAKLREMDPEEIKKKQRAAMDAMLAKIQKAAERSKTTAFTEEQMATLREQMEKQTDQMLAPLLAAREGRSPLIPAHGKERPGTIGFSRDARWLWCGTNEGLRVYDWSTFPREHGASTPPPTYHFELPGDGPLAGSKWIYAIAEEPDAPAVAFGGTTGTLYRLDLATGRVSYLIKLPGDDWIVDLQLTPDARTLGIATQADLTRTSERPRRRSKDDRRSWQVWSYPRLRESAQPIEPASTPSSPTR